MENEDSYLVTDDLMFGDIMSIGSTTITR